VPLIRPSQMRTMSRTPSASNFFGNGMVETSDIRGSPYAPQPRGVSTVFASTSSGGSCGCGVLDAVEDESASAVLDEVRGGSRGFDGAGGGGVSTEDGDAAFV
jgi:hypothetical protein